MNRSSASPETPGEPQSEAWDPLLAEAIGAEELDGVTARQLEARCTDVVLFEVRKFFGSSADRWREDVESEVWLRLWSRIRSGLAGNDPPIADVVPYVRRCAQSVCVDHLRAASPRRTRVEYRLRYLVRDDASWQRTQLANGDWVAERVDGAPRRTSDVRAAQRLLVEVHRVLDTHGGRVGWTDLVNEVAQAIGELDARPLAPTDRPRADGPVPVEQMARRQFLERLWQEIGELPPHQRRALLLNLRVASGEDAAGQFVACGFASPDQLAEALGVSIDELSSLLDRLPIGDEEIALRLGLDRRQVINARLSARRRLARRLGDLLS